MPFLHEQVEIINGIFKSSLNDSRFDGTKWGVVAKEVVRKNEAGRLEIFPGNIDKDGKEIYYGIDDNYPMVVYHKIFSITYERGRFGEIGRTQMKMVVSSTQKKVKLTSEQLEALFAVHFPQQVDKTLFNSLKINAMTVNLQNSNLNQRQVFTEEYSNEYFLGVEHILFSMTYTIETHFKQGCLEVCDCD